MVAAPVRAGAQPTARTGAVRPASDEEATMRRVFLAALAAGLILGSLGCAGKQSAGSMDETFMRYDTNRDGVITREEFVGHWQDKQQAATAWKLLDKNDSGSLDRGQAKALPIDVWGQLESAGPR